MKLRQIWTRTMDEAPAAISMDPHGGYLAVAGRDGSVSLLSRDNQTVWRGSVSQEIVAVDCGVRAQHVGLLTAAGSVLVIDAAGQPVKSQPLEFHSDIFALRPGSSAMLLANRYRLFRIATRSSRIVARGEVGHTADFARYSADGRAFIIAGADGGVTVFNSIGRQLFSCSLQAVIVAAGLTNGARSCICFTSSNGIISIDTQSGEQSAYQQGDSLASGAANDSGSRMIYLQRNDAVRLADIDTGTVKTLITMPQASLLVADTAVRECAIVSSVAAGQNQITWFSLNQNLRSSAKNTRDAGKSGSLLDFVELDQE